MDVALQYIVDKFVHATLAMGEKTNIKSEEAKSSQQKQKDGQLTCAHCAGNHKAIDCTKTKRSMLEKIVSLFTISASIAWEWVIYPKLVRAQEPAAFVTSTITHHCVINNPIVIVKVMIHHLMERDSPLNHLVVVMHSHIHNRTHIQHNSNNNNRPTNKSS